MNIVKLKVSRLAYDQHQFTKAEISRLHALPDRWLGEELLRLCREIRAAAMPFREEAGYNSFVMWDVVPEVAHRLGCRLALNESQDFDLKRATGQDFRDLVAICVVNVATGYLSEAETDVARNPIDILFHDVANGNPVAMALDRLVPPTPVSNDRFARSIREVARIRGFGEVCRWSPALNAKDVPVRMMLVPEDECDEEPASAFGL